MQMSKLNDWMQFGASVGVLVGILLVFLEIRQNNELATAEAISDGYTSWEEISRVEIETGIKELFVKSIEEPGELTTSEILKLDAWLIIVVSNYQRTVAMRQLGLGSDQTRLLEDAARYYFGGQFARAWFEENKAWMYTTPQVIEVFSRVIESTPAQTRFEYLDRIKSRL